MNIEEIMIEFLLHKATDEQIEEFFGYAPHGFNREEIEDNLSQMPDDVFDELVKEFGLSINGVNKLVQKVNWNLPNSPSQQLYVYGEASIEANQAMQEPLEKLYQYENQDIREKIREYIDELDVEIKRVEGEIVNTDDKDYEARMMSRIDTLIEVKNDLQGRLDEVV